jgi:hypothetical protein
LATVKKIKPNPKTIPYFFIRIPPRMKLVARQNMWHTQKWRRFYAGVQEKLGINKFIVGRRVKPFERMW